MTQGDSMWKAPGDVHLGGGRRWTVARVPQAALSAADFELDEVALPIACDGEILVRVLWLSIDPAARAWLQGVTYRGALIVGDVMPGFAIGQVVASDAPALPAGAYVSGDLGWRDFAAVRADDVQRIDPRRPLQDYLNVLGINGLAAYFGLFEVGRAAPGETVLVSAAAGATGCLAGQLARQHGCRVVGICGTEEKAAWLSGDLGFDAVINYRAGDLRAALKATCLDGVDVYFDNVGGSTLQAALGRMNVGGRIACCGLISQYDGAAPEAGPRGIPGLLITRQLTMRGYIVPQFADRFSVVLDELAAMLQAGTLIVREEVLDGLERAPEGLLGVLAGANTGKCLIRVAEPQPS